MESISPNFLARNWPPAFKEWPTKSVRNAFFASPQFPRLLSADSIKDTIATGVTNGKFAYVVKTSSGDYDPFVFGSELNSYDVEISDDVFITTKGVAEAYVKAKSTTIVEPGPDPDPKPDPGPNPDPDPDPKPALPTKMTWGGQIPAQKWMNFYTKVLSKHVLSGGLTVSINIEIAADEGISAQKIEETKAALRELGLIDNVKTEE